jgi:hypothetical protein
MAFLPEDAPRQKFQVKMASSAYPESAISYSF